jgi:hypothetical protein
MELVPLPGAISHHNRMETDILEALQTQGAGHLGVEAAVAKLSVTLLNRAIGHDIVGRDGRTARRAADHAAALLTFVSHVIPSDLVSAGEHYRSDETRPTIVLTCWSLSYRASCNPTDIKTSGSAARWLRSHGAPIIATSFSQISIKDDQR